MCVCVCVCEGEGGSNTVNSLENPQNCLYVTTKHRLLYFDKSYQIEPHMMQMMQLYKPLKHSNSQSYEKHRVSISIVNMALLTPAGR